MNDPAAIANSIAAAITHAVADPAVSASALLLPEVTDLELLTQISLLLGGLPDWQTKTTELKGTPGGDVVAIHLTRMIPFGAKQCPSEALALGPFECFPATRRAPVTALEIFVGEPSEFDPKKGPGHPTEKANVAHMDLKMRRPFW
ncbi:MAG TPA: hypothetical protein VJV39_02220, partial [Dongiaceae bacterium]|nr:hypothetical protein [Dongiaceae bacterium]